ncbi:MAG: hypothetical protein QXH26_01515 [Candidatus Hadarchaeales archaeon]
MEETEAELREKMARAMQLLCFKHHMEPGAKAWELRHALGKNYEQVLKALQVELERLGLTIKKVPSGGETESDRYFVTLRGSPPLAAARTYGWRVDEMGMLTAILAQLLVKGGKIPLKEVVQLLEEKFPKFRVDMAVEKFIRRGYLEEDEEGMLYLGWRTRAEVDEKTLMGLLLGKTPSGEKKSE